MDFIFDPSLVLYLPLHLVDGSSFMSKDRHGHLGTITGAVWRLKGRYFTTDDYLTVGDTSTFKFLHGALDTAGFQLTIAFWMSLPTPEPDAIWGLLGTALWTTSEVGLTIGYDDRSGSGKSRDMTFHIERGVAGYVCDFEGNNNLYPNDSEYHLVVFTYDQALASNSMKFFIDTVLKAQQSKTGNAPSTANSSQALNIGSREGTTQPATVLIPELWIYNRVLSPLEIQHKYLATKWRYR